jgi:hypothetical protein
LSRGETFGVVDELKGLGVFTEDIHAQTRDCILLTHGRLHGASALRSRCSRRWWCHQLGEMRGRFAALSPDQQPQLASELVQTLREAPAADPKAFRDGLGKRFFPPAVLQHVRVSGALD